MIRGVAVVLVLAGVTLAACAPTVIWTGHSADRRHTIEIAAHANVQWVAVDGKRRAAYRSIAAWSLATGEGERLVYAASNGAAWVVVDDGRPGAAWTGIGEIAISGPHTAYAAERAGQWQVVVDGVAGAAWQAILAGTLRWAHAGAHVAYVATDAAGAHVVVDGRAGPAQPGVAELALSDDAAHVAYIARTGETAAVVIDGVAGPSYSTIARLALAGDSAVYAARDGTGWHVVAGATTSGPYRAVRALTVTAGHAAWIARDADGASDVAVCDGELAGRAAAIAEERFAIVQGCELAYAAHDPEGWRVVRASPSPSALAPASPRSGDVYDELGALTSAGGHVAVAARRGDAWQVVLDGVAHDAGTSVGAPVLGADGARLGFVAQRAGHSVVVVDDRAYRFDLVMDGSLAFSRDGRHWAVLAGELATERLFFAVDGDRRVPLAPAEIYSASAQQALVSPLGSSAAGDVLRVWAAAEAEKE